VAPRGGDELPALKLIDTTLEPLPARVSFTSNHWRGGCVPIPTLSLIEKLRKSAAERRLLARQSSDSESRSLIAKAEEFENLATVLEQQEVNTPVPPVGPIKPGEPWKLR
jgi:hypothetical protein